MDGFSDSLVFRWLYIDFNSYFASVEQQLDPTLRGKPIAVVPVQTDSTCAIAASYEAKAFGIRTGTPIYEAKRMCPDLICVLAQHEAYLHFHQRILVEVEKHLPIQQICSIDEMACELMDNENSIEKATQIAHRIKGGLKAHVGSFIKCSIGIAPNRYLAKLATDMQKPDGLTFLHAKDLPHKLYSLKLRDFPGIGFNMEQRLIRFGITDVRSLCELDRIQIRKVWGGVWGERMWYFIRGIHLPDLETKRRSLGHSHVLSPELREPSQARRVALRLVLKLGSRLRRMDLVASNICLALRLEEGSRYETSLNCWQVSDSLTLIQLLDQLWKKLLLETKGERIKKISITVSRVDEVSQLQPELFLNQDLEARAKANRLSQAIDAINHQYGRDSILLGILPAEGKSFSGTKIAFTRIPDAEEFLE